MESQHSFTVYNAAAGAGKTYTLVKEYLIQLLNTKREDNYKNILAITFTNKAVGEMKTRILETLQGISEPEISEKYKTIWNDIYEEIGGTEKDLKEKATKILKKILHNYATFDVVTIDTFTHRVIRTFAHDLEIPMNFEIEMDTDFLLQEAVDSLINKAGVEEALTQIIIAFAFYKLEEDKSWDITLELNKIAKLLLSENDRNYIARLTSKTPKDFENLKKKLVTETENLQLKTIASSKNILEKFDQQGLEKSDFTRGSIPTHFLKLSQGEILTDYTAAWKQEITTASFYSAKLDASKKERIDTLRSEIENVFLETKQAMQAIGFYKNILKNLTPLSVLNAIHNEVEQIKKEQHILLISEFNAIISNAIKDQPAPFIYERLGERYKSYFIDEFQDTSVLQWHNLIPLIDSALSGENLEGETGSLVIVGDAKQAIYRWRGGKAEQFISLSNDENPFSIQDKKVLNLPTNYRSYSEIIKFNNEFFTYLSKEFSDTSHQELYLEGNRQETNAKKGGYVNISFIEAKNAVEEDEAYAQRTYEIVEALLEKGYRLNEICILTRRQKEGIAIANYLTTKEIDIVSSETLLINNSHEVRCIINILKLAMHPNDLLLRVEVLYYLANKFDIADHAQFLADQTQATIEEFERYLSELGIEFEFNQLFILPLYESVEYIIRSFKLHEQVSAYIQFFLDIVYDFTQKNIEGIIGFLSYWEQRKDRLSIVAPKGRDAIQIMTIHKSKGLEFPCVIYPYANVDIYRELEPKVWIPVDEEDYEGFGEVFVNYNKTIADIGIVGERLVQYRESQLELDAINILYVALTRAEEQLYIVSKLDLSAKGIANKNKFSGKLINYLSAIEQWNREQLEYSFGEEKRSSELQKIKDTEDALELNKMINTSKEAHNINIVTNQGKLWDTNQQDAAERGVLLHDILAKIKTEKDIKPIVEEAYQTGIINEKQKEELKESLFYIITSEELKKYFDNELTILNERDIFSNGEIYRPDRVVINQYNKAVVIDYKTGLYETGHEEQVYDYGVLLEKLGYSIDKRILVYINEKMEIKYV